MLRSISKLRCPWKCCGIRYNRHFTALASLRLGTNRFTPPKTENEKRSSYFARDLASLKQTTISITRSFFTNSPLNNLQSRTCWKCGQDTNPEKELFFCICGVVQRPARDVTLFDLLKIEQGFDIDVKNLSQHYKDTQRKLHPDNFFTKSKEERDFSEEQSSLLNKSYEILLKPLSRAIYLLELENIIISEDDSVTDPEFLMTMMDNFEAIDKASSPEETESVENENDLKIDECVKELSKAFLERDLIKAKTLTIELRYFTTIQERIKDLRLKSFGP